MIYIYIIIVSCLFAQNIAGTFRCACPEGFIQHFYRNECVDDNECNQSPCGSGTCYNTYGSYRCGCPDGYQFDTALSVCIQVKSFLYMTEKMVILKLSFLCSQMFCMYCNRKYKHCEELQYIIRFITQMWKSEALTSDFSILTSSVKYVLLVGRYIYSFVA